MFKIIFHTASLMAQRVLLKHVFVIQTDILIAFSFVFFKPCFCPLNRMYRKHNHMEVELVTMTLECVPVMFPLFTHSHTNELMLLQLEFGNKSKNWRERKTEQNEKLTHMNSFDRTKSAFQQQAVFVLPFHFLIWCNMKVYQISPYRTQYSNWFML